ncbi:MAG: hydroxymethylbilane synthase [Proteobacteria bacterium]|nr:hydroxymethylbilane synthase [Pseudomonadota bacterium]
MNPATAPAPHAPGPPPSAAGTDARPDAGTLRIGTRPSPLALVQTRGFLALLAAAGARLRDRAGAQEVVIRTTGDTVQDRRLADIGGKGLFAKEIHEALADRRIDCAVHSLKDLETTLPPGIVLACVLAREDARDALILRAAVGPIDPAHPFATLSPGATVATASLRRQAQLLHARPDLRVVMLRGNVQTRLDKLAAGAADATMLALAGLRRLGLDHHAAVAIDPDTLVPAAGQGIVGITVRADDTELRELLARLADPDAHGAATAERSLLAALDGSCHTPIGAYARCAHGTVHLTGLLARPDGTYLDRQSLSGPATDAARLGTELGTALRSNAPPDVLG